MACPLTFSSSAPSNPPAISRRPSTSSSPASATAGRSQTLLGVTGTGKTFTAANVIAQIGKPTLVLSHNKTLAAQLYKEFNDFFPHNAVHYFVSYYDYYQPEAYIPQRDIYIEKDASINENIDRLRLAATSALVSREDVIIVASVSCIYGLGSPSDYKRDDGPPAPRARPSTATNCCCKLVDIQYERNDVGLQRGKFRVRGDVIEVWPAYEEFAFRIELFGDEVDALAIINPTSGETLRALDELYIYPAKHFVTPEERIRTAVEGIQRRAGGTARRVPPARQAAGSPAAARPHALRHGNAAGGRPLPRHRELRPLVHRPQARRAALHAARLLPRRFPDDRRRIARHGAAGARHVRRRPQPQDRRWSSTASACPAPSTIGRCGSTNGKSASSR